MDEVYSFLSKYINSQLKNYKFSSENELNNIIDEYYDEYKKNFIKTKNKEDALNETLSSFNNEYLLNANIKKSTFALLISMFYFLIEVIKSIIGMLIANPITEVSTINPILLVISIFVLIFLLVTYKKRTKVDFIIFILLFISIIVINIEGFVNFYGLTMDGVSYRLDYIFPGLLLWKQYFNGKFNSTITLFDPTLIVSFICLITSLMIYIIESKKENKLIKK